MSLQPRPELSDLFGRDEAENVVRLRLAHQLANQVSTDVGIRIPQATPKLLERHIAIPEKVRPTFGIQEFLPGRGIEHEVSVAPLVGSSISYALTARRPPTAMSPKCFAMSSGV